jgi:hypothetical protein
MIIAANKKQIISGKKGKGRFLKENVESFNRLIV